MAHPTQPIAPAVPTGGAGTLTPIPLTAVRFDEGSFFARLQARNAVATLPHVVSNLETSGVLDNLRASSPDRAHVGMLFSDSDLYKTLEAIGWEKARSTTTRFDSFLAEAADLLRGAQEEDGYLNSWTGSASGPGRWMDLQWGHELYCGGHLVQAAVALSRAGCEEFLPVARRWADHVVVQFAERGFGGHPEVETALVELSRATGEPRYRDLALRMVERRGNNTLPQGRFDPRYFQDHEPAATAREAAGHAVRQLYLDAAVADLLLDGLAEDHREALVSRWESAHHTKMHVSGGMGSRHFDESFGAAHELPPDRGYAETCAAIADFQLSWRMLLLTGEDRYADAMERVLHNALPASLSEDGTAFFYSCPLQLRSTHHGEQNAPRERVSWYDCACCPPNIARVIASLGAYMAAVDGDVLVVQQHGSYTITLPPAVGSGTLALRHEGETLRLELDGTLVVDHVRVRRPRWQGAGGYVDVDMTEGRGAVPLDASPRVVHPHHRADALRGCVAVLCGPVVMCAESVDNPDLEDLVFAPSRLEVVDGTVRLTARRRESRDLYDPDPPVLIGEPIEARLIAYREWGNRGADAMRVWLPVGPESKS